jgi:hypothetical protein
LDPVPDRFLWFQPHIHPGRCLMDVISKPPGEVMLPVEVRDRHGIRLRPSSAPVVGVKRGMKMFPGQKI